MALTPSNVGLLIGQVTLLQQSGQLDAAGEALSVLAKRHPDHPKLPWLRGGLATARKDYAAAAAIHAEALAAHPGEAKFRIRLASNLKQLERYEEALAVLAEGLALAPGAADLLVEQIAALQQSGQLDAAGEALSVLAKRHPDHPKLSWLRGGLATARKDYAAAAAIHAEALAAHPGGAKFRIRLASNLKQLERYEEALAVLTEGLALAPGAADLLVERVATLRASGQFDAAETALAAFAERYPDHPSLPSLRAELARARGDHAAAAAIHAGALRARPQDTSQRLRLTASLRQLRRYEEAQAILAQGLALAPGDPKLLMEQLLLLQQTGQLDQAERAFAAFAERYPDHPRLRLLRAELADAMGDHKTALEVLEVDLSLNPDDTGRRLRVSSRLARAGLVPEALALIGDPPLRTQGERVARATALMQLGRWDDAAKELRDWSSDTPRAATARARCEMQLAMLTFDTTVARIHAERFLADNPGDSGAAQTLVSACMLAFDADVAWSAMRQIPILPAGSGPARLGGRRLRHSFGQIINELRLRPRETRMLAAAAASSGEMQARRAAVLLRKNPDSVGAAMALLIGMVRAGRFAGSSAAGPSRRQIPLKLHQYWDGDLHADIERLMDETAAVNTGFTYRRWNDAEARRYLSTLDRPDLLRAYREAKHVAIRVDVFRLALLLTQGGVYLDADDRCAGPLDTLLAPGAQAVFYQEHLGSIGNNFLAAAPGHPIIATALNEAIRAVLEGAGESAWLATGPGLLSRVVAVSIAHSRALDLPRDVHVIPQSAFRRTVQACRRALYKRGTQHWPRAVN